MKKGHIHNEIQQETYSRYIFTYKETHSYLSTIMVQMDKVCASRRLIIDKMIKKRKRKRRKKRIIL